jgi:hypothetical protein
MKRLLRDAAYGAELKKLLCSAAILWMSIVCSMPSAVAAEKWHGVDESVVEKFAKEQGRGARAPFINTDQGDLLLFVFLLAGTIGGFAAGYYWRILMVEKAEKTGKEGFDDI